MFHWAHILVDFVFGQKINKLTIQPQHFEENH